MKFSGKMAAAIVLLLALASTLPAQDSPVECKQFRMLLTDGSHVNGKDGVLANGAFSGTSKDGSSVNLKIEEIRSMDRSVGSKAGEGALLGAGLGALSVLLAIMQVNSDPDREVDGSKVPAVLVGFTAAGALIGAAVGSSSQRWEKVPLPAPMGIIDNRGLHLSFSIHF